MKREKQINESREMIVRAFQKLLGEADYKEITLTEIADHAGLSRMTLHRHFKSKEEIVFFIAERFRKAAMKNWNGDRDSVGDWILFQLDQMLSMPNRHLLTESREIWDILESFRKDSWIMRIEKILQVSYEQEAHLFHFLYGGISNMIYEWLKSGCKDSASEMRDSIMSNIEKHITKQ